MNDKMTISYHSSFLLYTKLLFPEYSFYSIQHITFILYLSIRMSTTSHVHSMLISIFKQSPLKNKNVGPECFCICIIYFVNTCKYLNDICVTYWPLQCTKFVIFSFLQLESTRQWKHGCKKCEREQHRIWNRVTVGKTATKHIIKNVNTSIPVICNGSKHSECQRAKKVWLNLMYSIRYNYFLFYKFTGTIKSCSQFWPYPYFS